MVQLRPQAEAWVENRGSSSTLLGVHYPQSVPARREGAAIGGRKVRRSHAILAAE